MNKKNNSIDIHSTSIVQSFFEEKNRHSTNWALIFVFYPIAVVVWIASTTIKMPLDFFNSFLFTLKLSIPSFVFFWILSYRNIFKDKALIGLTIFFVMFWLITTYLLVSKINDILDTSTPQIFREKVISSTYSSSKKGGSSCLVYLENKVLNLDSIKLKGSYCDDYQSHKNGVELHIKNGFFGFPYLYDYMIIKNFDQFMKKTNLQ